MRVTQPSTFSIYEALHVRPPSKTGYFYKGFLAEDIRMLFEVDGDEEEAEEPISSRLLNQRTRSHLIIIIIIIIIIIKILYIKASHP
jgi:hypothetical protein